MREDLELAADVECCMCHFVSKNVSIFLESSSLCCSRPLLLLHCAWAVPFSWPKSCFLLWWGSKTPALCLSGPGLQLSPLNHGPCCELCLAHSWNHDCGAPAARGQPILPYWTPQTWLQNLERAAGLTLLPCGWIIRRTQTLPLPSISQLTDHVFLI